MSDKREALKVALEDVKAVAKGLHVPIDLSTLEKAIEDVVGEAPKEEKKDEKPEEKDEAKPEPTPAQPAQRAPVGVNLNR